jgi:hypothetical protein
LATTALDASAYRQLAEEHRVPKQNAHAAGQPAHLTGTISGPWSTVAGAGGERPAPALDQLSEM